MASDENYRARFSDAEKILDGLMMGVRPAIDSLGISFEDRSNRSGFDWVAPYYLWAADFIRQELRGAYTYRVVIRLEYIEALLPDYERSLNVKRKSEIFQPGKESVFVDESSELLPFAKLSDEVLIRKISTALTIGWQRLENSGY